MERIWRSFKIGYGNINLNPNRALYRFEFNISNTLPAPTPNINSRVYPPYIDIIFLSYFRVPDVQFPNHLDRWRGGWIGSLYSSSSLAEDESKSIEVVDEEFIHKEETRHTVLNISLLFTNGNFIILKRFTNDFTYILWSKNHNNLKWICLHLFSF